MNDRFKFRAYNKELRKMYEVNTICPYEDNHTKGGEVFLNGIQYNSFYFPEEVEVMQCTGLKDKNGKLIYEGDILKDDKNLFYEVIFKLQEYATSFSLKRREIPDYYPHITTWCGLGYRNCNKYEVIGNIYQNKELLEDTECQNN